MPVGAGAGIGTAAYAATPTDGAAPPDDGAAEFEEVEPAAAPGPSFAWRDVGTYLLSERTLHGLLGLGALLILASGVVISTLNPTGLGPVPHLGAVIATTLLFFIAGYVVRQRLRLTIAGATLLGIAGAFVPMTIWTLGQERLLNWETGAIWLVSSLVSLPLYLAVHRLLRDRTFAVLAALAGGSEVLAVLNWLGVPLEWGLAGLALLAIGYVRLAWRLRISSAAFSWALLRAAQAATPVVLALPAAGEGRRGHLDRHVRSAARRLGAVRRGGRLVARHAVLRPAGAPVRWPPGRLRGGVAAAGGVPADARADPRRRRLGRLLPRGAGVRVPARRLPPAGPPRAAPRSRRATWRWRGARTSRSGPRWWSSRWCGRSRKS